MDNLTTEILSAMKSKTQSRLTEFKRLNLEKKICIKDVKKNKYFWRYESDVSDFMDTYENPQNLIILKNKLDNSV